MATGQREIPSLPWGKKDTISHSNKQWGLHFKKGAFQWGMLFLLSCSLDMLMLNVSSACQSHSLSSVLLVLVGDSEDMTMVAWRTRWSCASPAPEPERSVHTAYTGLPYTSILLCVPKRGGREMTYRTPQPLSFRKFIDCLIRADNKRRTSSLY